MDGCPPSFVCRVNIFQGTPLDRDLNQSPCMWISHNGHEHDIISKQTLWHMAEIVTFGEKVFGEAHKLLMCKKKKQTNFHLSHVCEAECGKRNHHGVCV